MKRHLVLPERGVLLVSADVHGNDEDMARLEALFLDEQDRRDDAHWVILGDVVHAPSAAARAEHPALYDHEDGSMRIVDRILRLEEEHPGHVHFVLGNHDHAHVGGPRTGKFHPDEARALEEKLSPAERARLVAAFERALLAVAAPCGVLLTHGAPDTSLEDLRLLDGIPLDAREMTSAQARIVRPLLRAYGQPDAVARAMLDQLAVGLGFPLGVLVHGHDRAEDGFFREGQSQLCPCIFGAPRAEKRYLRLDLAARYGDAFALRDGVEIRRLHPDATSPRSGS